jgi:rare lipoprotein A
MNLMTAAHRTMPFGTWVEVLNLSNRKETRVRITDRGPFIEGRIIDLSRRAAEEIALIGPGVTKVRLRVIEPPPGEVVERYGVQLGAFSDEGLARDLAARVTGGWPGGAATVYKVEGDLPYRVIGGAGTREEARAWMLALRASKVRGVVVRVPQPHMRQPANAGVGTP